MAEDAIKFWFESSVDTIQLTEEGPFLIQSNTLGFGVPPLTIRYLEGAGAGGKRYNSRVGMRPLDVGLLITAADRMDLDTKARYLAKVLRVWSPPPKIVAEYPTGERYSLTFDYLGGLEGNYQDVDADTYKVVLSLMCPQPYWEAVEPQGFTLKVKRATTTFRPKLGDLAIDDAQVIGTVDVFNAGEVPAPLSWMFVGPASEVFVQSDLGSFHYNAPLAVNETIFINSEEGTVTGFFGENKYDSMGLAPKFFSLPPGTTRIDVQMPDATPDSQVVATYMNRREVIL